MRTIHKLNGGDGATLCNACRTIITEGLTTDVLCKVCNDNYTLLSQSFDSRARVMRAVKDMAKKRVKGNIKKAAKERAANYMYLKKKEPTFYCQSDIEGNFLCDNQCYHCEEYYKPIENKL